MTATFIFTMGLPGAGKSTVTNRMFPEAQVIDPDAIKEAHPDYDPKNAAALHAYSKEIAEEKFAAALAQGEGENLLDGTGTNVEVLVGNIRRAQAAGFVTKLVFVTVSLETALIRNAARERNVPENIVREKAATIYTAFEIAAKEANEVEVVWND